MKKRYKYAFMIETGTELDTFRGNAGFRCAWERRRILVPEIKHEVGYIVLALYISVEESE